MTDKDYLVIDTETSIKNRGPDAVGTFKASPFHPDNRMVLGGFKNSQSKVTTVTPAIFMLASEDIYMLVGHNIGFDLLYYRKECPGFINWLKNGGIIWDTMIAEYLLTGQQDKFASLNTLAAKYGGTQKNDKIKEYWENDIDTEDIPKFELEEYLKDDVLNTEKVFLAQFELAEELGMIELIKVQMEARLATVEMEWNGMFFDKDGANEQMGELLSRADLLHDEIYGIMHTQTGLDSVSPTSSQHLSAILFGGEITIATIEATVDANGVPVRYKTGARSGQVKTKKGKSKKKIKGLIANPNSLSTKGKNGFYSTDNKVLTKVTKKLSASRAKYLCWKILEYRELEKDISTYYTGYSELCWPTDSCIHPTYNHAATDTGRLSCSKPNLQNSSHGG